MSDLIKRLRGLRIDSRSDDMAMIEAADALDAKDAEIARLRRLIDTAAETGDIYEQRLCEREAENERLRELLRGARNKLSGSYSNIELRDRIDATLAGTADQPSVARGPYQCAYCAVGFMPVNGWHHFHNDKPEPCTAVQQKEAPSG